jgi:hypothetical protein
MCRSIKVLRTIEPPATPDDVSAAALQFVRKVSGYRKPSRANEQVFNRAIVEIAGSVEKLLSELDSPRGLTAPDGRGSKRRERSKPGASPAN